MIKQFFKNVLNDDMTDPQVAAFVIVLAAAVFSALYMLNQFLTNQQS